MRLEIATEFVMDQTEYLIAREFVTETQLEIAKTYAMEILQETVRGFVTAMPRLMCAVYVEELKLIQIIASRARRIASVYVMVMQ